MTSTTTKTKRPVYTFAIMDSEYGFWGETWSDGEPRKTHRFVQVGTAESVSEAGALRKYSNANGLYGYSHLRAVNLTQQEEREAAEAKHALELSLKKFMSGYDQKQLDEVDAWAAEHWNRAQRGKRALGEIASGIRNLESVLRNLDARVRNLVASDIETAINRLEEEKPGLIESTRAHLVAYVELQDERTRVGLRDTSHEWREPQYVLEAFDNNVTDDDF
jgi:hypothetical protein